MLLFWAVAGCLAAATAGLILYRAARAAEVGEVVDPAQALYRRQLLEIDDLVERGLMGPSERAGAHAEAGRRLLAAADAAPQAWTPDPRAQRLVLLAAVSAPALALGLYLTLGAPGVPDQPYAQRLAAWRGADLTTLAPDQIAAVLREATAKRPNDAEGYRLLGLAEDAAQNPLAAVQALKRAAALAPQRADIWRMLGQAAFVAAGGKVDREAESAFHQLLALEPGDPTARFFLAQAKADAGQTTQAAADLRTLLADMPAGVEGRREVAARLAALEGKPVVPTADPAQQAMIRGMVEGLAGRLATKPDDAEGWVKLVRAYAVLGDLPRRDEAYGKARARFAEVPDVLQQLDEAARAEPMR